jgi:hypothetical protein
MDQIDQMIINAELAKTFPGDEEEDETRRYRFIGRKPNNPAKRKAVYDRTPMQPDEGKDKK